MNDKYRAGIENLPIDKVNNSCPIFVIVRNLRAPDEADDVVAEYKWDLSNPDHRKRLGRLSFWCTENHHSVETMALSDANGE